MLAYNPTCFLALPSQERILVQLISLPLACVRSTASHVSDEANCSNLYSRKVMHMLLVLHPQSHICDSSSPYKTEIKGILVHLVRIQLALVILFARML